MDCYGTHSTSSDRSHPTFSILQRIEWTVTWAATRAAAWAATSFSILQRIEWTVTVVKSGQSLAVSILSVSSNGSNGLLLRGSCPGRPSGTATFSILQRIEWTVTLEAARYAHGLPLGFQYPPTDRMDCYMAKHWIMMGGIALSVSSNGSNGLLLKMIIFMVKVK